MNVGDIMMFIQESLYMIVAFSVFLIYAMIKGHHALVNLIFALYLALLISIKFPYYNVLIGDNSEGGALLKITIFAVFVFVGAFLLRKYIYGNDYEPAFYKFWRKIILAVLAVILLMAFSFHALPVTEIITPGTPIQSLFAPEENFFWWLILPLVVLSLL